ncbi:hypothetical protein GCM10007199_09740 [Fictibacillus barbaricus]|nr:hypothetical protein GCM10007199_09740 [Fictibacillus barbaricus]
MLQSAILKHVKNVKSFTYNELRLFNIYSNIKTDKNCLERKGEMTNETPRFTWRRIWKYACVEETSKFLRPP